MMSKCGIYTNLNAIQLCRGTCVSYFSVAMLEQHELVKGRACLGLSSRAEESITVGSMMASSWHGSRIRRQGVS